MQHLNQIGKGEETRGNGWREKNASKGRIILRRLTNEMVAQGAGVATFQANKAKILRLLRHCSGFQNG